MPKQNQRETLDCAILCYYVSFLVIQDDMITSMTAFEKLSEAEWETLTLEIRMVNHRYLEISCRLPVFCVILTSSKSLDADVPEAVIESKCRLRK